MPQFTDESRKVAWKNLNTRIENAEGEITKITHYPIDEKAPGYDAEKAGKAKPEEELTAKNKKDIQYLQKRIRDFQLSLRLAFNTNWIIEQRTEQIDICAEKMRVEFGPTTAMTEDKQAAYQKTIARLNALTKAKKCTRKGCYTGRGYTGLNISTGEFNFCKCTLDTIDYYKLHD